MAKAATARSTLPGGSLPEEIVVWEILVRLPPKSLLRCRSVCSAWRRVTSTHDFLLAHHDHQPSLPVLSGDSHCSILAFDSRVTTIDDQLHAVAQLDYAFFLEASCDGLLVLSKLSMTASSGPFLYVCNPATRQHAPLEPLCGFTIMGMYQHCPTGEYRLLLQRRIRHVADQIGLYVFPLGSDQPPRYIDRWPEITSEIFNIPGQVRDSLHWYPVDYRTESLEWKNSLIVFDTIAEVFRQMRAPIVPTGSCMFDMDDTLGIYTHNYATGIMDVWVLQNYKGEVWDLKYRIKLPLATIRREFVDCGDCWDMDIVSVDGGVLLLIKVDEWLFHVDSHGKLVNSFDRRGRRLHISDFRLKQSLVQHNFFPALQTLNASPFI